MIQIVPALKTLMLYFLLLFKVCNEKCFVIWFSFLDLVSLLGTVYQT